MYLRHKIIFWMAIGASLATGISGLAAGRLIIAIPYAFLNPLLLWIIPSFFKTPEIKNRLEILGSIILLTSIPGSVYFHPRGIQYDVIDHFLSGFLGFIMLATILSLKLKNKKSIFMLSFIGMAVGGLGFEGFQKLSDLILGTKLFFDAAQPIAVDFAIDIIMDIVGAAVGFFYAAKIDHFFKIV